MRTPVSMTDRLVQLVTKWLRWLDSPWQDADDVKWLMERKSYYKMKIQQIDSELMRKLKP